MIKNKAFIFSFIFLGLSTFCQNALSQIFYGAHNIGTPDQPTIEGGRLDTRIKKSSEPEYQQKTMLVLKQRNFAKELLVINRKNEQAEHHAGLDSSSDWMNHQKIQKVLKMYYKFRVN